VNVRAYLNAIGPKEEALEQIVTRLSLEPRVTALSWEVAAAVERRRCLYFGLWRPRELQLIRGLRENLLTRA